MPPNRIYSDLQTTLEQLRFWKKAILATVVMAALSFMLTAVLFVRLSDTTDKLERLGNYNCSQNRKQDVALAALVRISLGAADPHMKLTKRQQAAKNSFQSFVKAVENEKPCVPGIN